MQFGNLVTTGELTDNRPFAVLGFCRAVDRRVSRLFTDLFVGSLVSALRGVTVELGATLSKDHLVALPTKKRVEEISYTLFIIDHEDLDMRVPLCSSRILITGNWP